MKDEGKLQEVGNEDKLFEHISSLIEESRRHIVKAVNTAMVYTYYGVGQYIVEFEQNGDYRAAYGKGVLNRLSTKLTGLFGKGWSVDTLENCRKFFQVYSISSDDQTKSETLSRKSGNHFMRFPKRRLGNLITGCLSHFPGLIILFSCASTIPMPVVSMR